MGCGCKKNKKEKKEQAENVNSHAMRNIIRKKIIEQIQKGNSNPKPSQ
jgi:hypothetical protein